MKPRVIVVTVVPNGDPEVARLVKQLLELESSAVVERMLDDETATTYESMERFFRDNADCAPDRASGTASRTWDVIVKHPGAFGNAVYCRACFRPPDASCDCKLNQSSKWRIDIAAIKAVRDQIEGLKLDKFGPVSKGLLAAWIDQL